ncbi:hypothetical protein HMPREF2998_00005 [Corynebacterium sp. HMSC065A05]|uniref:hypothetical protein n=1 Tax=Corynebacterium sp. HMSC065A05 TaxID=1739502 RepID=UPI0008A2A8C3|nr:hypothetical protein [Corynebacterium sp. HMSC065A05]OFP21439.1 hypothetical protein HMPREF2998_00005 [Corynebacterium sp. HMSC065A05]
MTQLNPVLVIIGGLIALAALGYLYLKVTIYEQIKREEREETTDDPTMIRDRAHEVFVERFDHFSRKYGVFYQPMSIVGDREELGKPITGRSKPISVPRTLAAFDIEIPVQLVRSKTMSWAEVEESLRRIGGEIQGNCDIEVHKPAGQTAYRVEVYA